jgi:hypothetical protein
MVGVHAQALDHDPVDRGGQRLAAACDGLLVADLADGGHATHVSRRPHRPFV